MPAFDTTADAKAPQTSRGQRGRGGPVAIVDIGSNSVRLVVYESFSRTPAVMHNEKAICAIGRNMVSTGRLNDEGIALAIEALARYRMIADALHVDLREAVATAAARDAPNGDEFVRKAEAVWGGPIRILSGEEEARVAAEGVLSGIPDADGLAADLGGGSLDMVPVKNGKTGEALTFPFGPLRLVDLAKGDADRARDIVDEGLAQLQNSALKGRTLYAVGGVWRSFARVDMEDVGYPLHVLHNYEIPRPRALKLARVVSRMGRKSIDKMGVISRRRAEALPYGAIVLERLLEASDVDRVVISAFGLREGLLHVQLPAEERAKDPLIEFAAGVNRRQSRVAGHAGELFEWMEPLFPGESDEERRIRQAVCLFSDIGWRRHPDDRALGAFNQVVTAPFAGASHRARALIATAIFHRYSGDEDFPRGIAAHDLLSEEDGARAVRLGLAARLGFALSVSALGELAKDRIRMTPTRVLLEISRRREAISGEPVPKRLGELAQSLGRKGEILIG
ncbi:MAG TPA: Ppx/GppA family phosphatase [Rhizomicrobium sp.]|nr:Ppx/GppA family phosphatase [Rhizomicrobium sp.]